MNLLKIIGYGNPSSNNHMQAQSMIPAGMGYEAHTGIQPGAEADLINRGAQSETTIQRQAGDLVHHIEIPIPHFLESASHTWTTVERRFQEATHIPIPWLD